MLIQFKEYSLRKILIYDLNECAVQHFLKLYWRESSDSINFFNPP